MGRVEGEERRARTRERLHSETAISRDEAFLNKQQRRRRSILCSFTKWSHCCGIAVFIVCPIVFLFISNVWGPYWQSNLVQRGVHGAHFFSQPVVCLCGGQLVHRFVPYVMTDDWWKLPTEWTGLVGTGGMVSPSWQSGARLQWDQSPSYFIRPMCFSKDSRVNGTGVSWQTVAWSQVDMSGAILFPAHLFILHCWFPDTPPGERQVGETRVPSGGD